MVECDSPWNIPNRPALFKDKRLRTGLSQPACGDDPGRTKANNGHIKFWLLSHARGEA